MKRVWLPYMNVTAETEPSTCPICGPHTHEAEPSTWPICGPHAHEAEPSTWPICGPHTHMRRRRKRPKQQLACSLFSGRHSTSASPSQLQRCRTGQPLPKCNARAHTRARDSRASLITKPPYYVWPKVLREVFTIVSFVSCALATYAQRSESQ